MPRHALIARAAKTGPEQGEGQGGSSPPPPKNLKKIKNITINVAKNK